MALQHILERPGEDILVDPVQEAQGERQVEDLAKAESSIDLPQRSLGKRQGRDQRGAAGRYGRHLRGLAMAHGMPGEAGSRGVAEQVVEMHLDAMRAQQAADDARGDEGMAAMVEEIVIGGHLRRGQGLAKLGQDELRHPILAMTGRRAGGGRGRSLRPPWGDQVLAPGRGQSRHLAGKHAGKALQQEGTRRGRNGLAGQELEGEPAFLAMRAETQSEIGTRGERRQRQALDQDAFERESLGGIVQPDQIEMGAGRFVLFGARAQVEPALRHSRVRCASIRRDRTRPIFPAPHPG